MIQLIIYKTSKILDADQIWPNFLGEKNLETIAMNPNIQYTWMQI